MDKKEVITVSGNVVDVVNRRIFAGRLTVVEGTIKEIKETDEKLTEFILPGFVDAHIHIESSMLVPYEFARIALGHGTVATVSDPHEIANVCGIAGVDYMIENARDAKLKFNFGAPSCVPATTFETAGATIDAVQIEMLMQRDAIKYLSEMMNYPGVLFEDAEVMKKIAAAHAAGKPVDGHAPGLRGEDARKYIGAGISTDHECFTLEEALDKLAYGMKILIREGSAAKNYAALHGLITSHTPNVMLCSDDKHPDDLLEGHINLLVKRALQDGHALMDVLRCACVNPVKHYKLNVGLLQEGDAADFVVVNNLEELKVLRTFVDGACVAEGGKTFLEDRRHGIINAFEKNEILKEDIAVYAKADRIKVIEAMDGQLITNCIAMDAKVAGGLVVSDVHADVLKIVVTNRYRKAKPVVGFVKNFGLKYGAIASTVAHDSHNIIAVGADDDDLVCAINLLMNSGGGLAAVGGSVQKTIALPVGGLMSDLPCREIGLAYSAISSMAKAMGSGLHAPYMTLSFMALLVIPHFKIGDKGLFDGDRFALTELDCCD
jgi:adenine deaminase